MNESIDMAIEHFKNYRLELIPFELAGVGRWAPYLTIYAFDAASQDFKCIFEKQRVSESAVFATADEAVDESRRVGNALIEAGNIG